MLGGIKGDVTLPQRCLLVAASVDTGEPDRRSRLDLRTLKEHRLGQRAQDLACNFLRGSILDAGKKNGELVASGASAAGALRRRFHQRLGDAEENLVAGKVAVEIVDALEMVEIEDQEHAPRSVLQRLVEG